MSEDSARLPLGDCVPGAVYRVSSRNLRVAVCSGNADGRFIGIREKFGDRYLFAEYHWDTGAPYGTLSPLEVLGTVPTGVELWDRHPPACSSCRRPVEFDRPVSAHGRGWAHLADGSPMCDHARAHSALYQPLFDVLSAHEAALPLGAAAL